MNNEEMFVLINSANRNTQDRARALNLRAGEELFTVFTVQQITKLLLQAMEGARSIAEIQDFEAMRIPLSAATEANAERLAEKVLAENPEQICLLGQLRGVNYRHNYHPRIMLEQDSPCSELLMLPDDGVRLPSGRAVEIVIKTDWSSIGDTNIPRLKTKLLDYLNSQAWSAWSTRPIIALPDPATDGAEIPPLIEAEYGHCASGRPLIGYGVVAVAFRHYYSSDPWFKTEWFREQQDAELARAKSVKKLEELRKEILQLEELETTRQTAKKLQERLAHFHSQNIKVDELFNRLSTKRYNSLPSDLPGLQKWLEESQQLIAEFETGDPDPKAGLSGHEEADAMKHQNIGETLVDVKVVAASSVDDQVGAAQEPDAAALQRLLDRFGGKKSNRRG